MAVLSTFLVSRHFGRHGVPRWAARPLETVPRLSAEGCGYGLPVPDHMDLEESPYHVFQGDSLIRPNGTAVAGDQ